MFLHVLVITGCGVLLISSDVDLSAGRDRDVLVTNSVTGTDLRALGIQSNGNLPTLLNLLSLAGIVDNGLVVFVGAVGEVHANNVKTGSAELVDGLDRVCLGADCADDGGAAVVLGWLELGVQLGEPFDLSRAGAEVVKGGRHLDSSRQKRVDG
jgi:hypothetical protein